MAELGLLPAGAAGGWGGWRAGFGEPGGEVPLVPHAVAVAANIDDVAVMEEPINQRAGHHVVAEDVAPFFEAFITREDGRRVFVPTTRELEKQLRADARDREIADFIDDHQTRKDERPHAPREMARLLRFFEPKNKIGERRIVDAASTLRGRDGQANREMRFPDAWWSPQWTLQIRPLIDTSKPATTPAS